MMQYYHAILDKADDIKTVAATTVASRIIFLIKEMQPDIILIDYAMQPIDGFKLMEQIQTELPHRAIILLGGHKNLRQTALDAGANDYLAVPITPKDLIGSIRRVARAKQV